MVASSLPLVQILMPPTPVAELPPPPRGTIPDAPLRLFDEEDEHQFYEPLEDAPPAHGSAEGALYATDLGPVSVTDMPQVSFATDSDTERTYFAHSGTFTSAFDAPHILNFSIDPEVPIAPSTTVLVDAPGVTEVISSPYLCPDSDDTMLHVTYDVLVDSQVQGNLSIVWQFAGELPPKMSASFVPVQGGPLENASLWWVTIPAFTFLRASNQQGETTTIDLTDGAYANLVELPWSNEGFFAEIGDAADVRDWVDRLNMSWEDQGAGSLWAGPITIDASHAGRGVAVKFPPGQFSIDPVMSGASAGLTLGEQAQRRSFYASDRYWLFWRDNGDIRYGWSPDGASWTGVNTVTTGIHTFSGFDVFQTGDSVLVTYVRPDDPNTWSTDEWGIWMALGTIRQDRIDWTANQQVWYHQAVFWTNIRPIYAVSGIIATDGFIWAAATLRDNGNVASQYVFESSEPGKLGNHNSPLLFAGSTCLGVSGTCTATDGSIPILVPREEGSITWIATTPGVSDIRYINYDPSYGWSGTGSNNDLLRLSGYLCLTARCGSTTLSAITVGNAAGVAFIDTQNRVRYFEITSDTSQPTPVPSTTKWQVVQSGETDLQVTLGQSALGDIYVAWLRVEVGPNSGDSSYIEYARARKYWHNGEPDYTWSSSPTVVWGPINTSAGKGPDAPHLPPRIFPAMMFAWRTEIANGTYKLAVKTVQIALASPGALGLPWGGSGITPTGSYLSEKGYWVSLSTGQLFYRVVDFEVPSRGGLSLIVPRLYQSPQFFNETNQPFDVEQNPYVQMGAGWGLDFPWVNDKYIFLPGGGRIPYSFTNGNTVEVKGGIPLRLTANASAPLQRLALNFSSGIRMELAKINISSSVYVIQDMWDNPSADATNYFHFNYYGSSSLNKYLLEGIVEHPSESNARTISFVYPAGGGSLSSITYYRLVDGSPTISTMKTYTYFTWGTQLGELNSTSGPLAGNLPLENYSYNSVVSPSHLTGIKFQEGGRAEFTFRGLPPQEPFIPAGTEARIYPLQGIDLYGWDDNNTLSPREIRARSTSINYSFIDGVMTHVRSAVASTVDGALSRTVQDIVNSPRRGYSATTIRDKNNVSLRQDVTWFNAAGVPWKIEHFVGNGSSPLLSSATPTGVEYTMFDDWGNPIYSRDATGYEVFASYVNTGSSGTLQSAARLDRTSTGELLVDRFSTWSADGWGSSLGCGSNGCISIARPYYDAPSLQLDTATGAYRQAVRGFPLTGAIRASFLVQIPDAPSQPIYKIELLDSTVGLIRTSLWIWQNWTNSNIYDVYGYFNSGSSSVWLGSITPGVWVKFAIYSFDTGNASVSLPGSFRSVPLYQPQTPTPSTYPKNQIRFTSSSTGAVARLLVNEVSVSTVLGTGDWGTTSTTFSGLPPRSTVELFDADGTPMGSVRASTSVQSIWFNIFSGSVYRVRIRDADGQILFDATVSISANDAFWFVPPMMLSAITKVESGFGKYRPLPSGGAANASGVIADETICPTGKTCARYGDTLYSSFGWDAAVAMSGTFYGKSQPVRGVHYHGFNGSAASGRWTLNAGEYLIQYVYIIPGARPSEIEVQFQKASDGSYVGAYWGDPKVGAFNGGYVMQVSPLFGADGRWMQLIVKVDDLGLANTDITGIYWTLYGGSVIWDLTSIGTNETGQVRIEDLTNGTRVDLVGDAFGCKRSATAGSNGVATINLYDTTTSACGDNYPYRFFPQAFRFKFFKPGSSTEVEHITALIAPMWGGDVFSYKRMEFYESNPVPQTMHGRVESTMDWDNGREGVSLDMQTRTLSTPYTMFDFSGYRNNGVGSQTGTQYCHGLNTAAPCLEPGKQGKSMEFDGSSTSVTVPATPYSTSTTGFSVALWLSPDDYWVGSGNCMINVISWSNPTMGYVPWYLEILPTQISDYFANLVAHVGYGSTEKKLWANDSIAISANDGTTPRTWTHVALTWDGHDMTLFINGLPVNWSGLEGVTLRPPYEGSPDIYVGKGWNTCSNGMRYFAGAIDELKIYPKGITDEQVREMYVLEGGAVNRTVSLAKRTFVQYNSLGLTVETKAQATVDQIGQSPSAWPWLFERWGYQSASGYFNPKNYTNIVGTLTNFSYSANYPLGAYLTNVTVTVNGASMTTGYTYTDLGQIKQEKTPMGYLTNYTYDAIGRVLTITHPAYDGTNNSYIGTFPQEVFTYDDARRVANWTAPSGWRLSTQFDGLGRVSLEKRYAPSGGGFVLDRKTQLLYNHLDQVWETIGPDPAGGANQQWVTLYDSLGRVIETQAPDARAVKTYTVYDDVNRLVTFKDEENKWTVYNTDLNGRLIGTCQWLLRPGLGADQSDLNLQCFPSATQSITVTTIYDLAGHPYMTIDGSNNRQKFNYDELGQVRKEWYPDGNQRTFNQQLDLLNHSTLDRYYNGYGMLTSQRFDGAGRLNLTWYPDGTTAWVGYDVDSRVNGTGNLDAVYSYAYNSWGQPTNKTTYIPAAGTTKTILLEYDRYSRVSIINNPAPNNVMVTYSYDIVQPGDNFDRVRAVGGNWQGGIDSIQYNKMDEVTIARINPTSPWNVNNTYDSHWRLLQTLVNLTAAGTQSRKWNYSYFKNGNVAQEYNWTGTANTRETYQYDDVGRLTSYTRGTSTTSYSYDKTGNRLTRTNATGVVTNYTYAGDQITRVWNSSISTNYTFGRDGQLVNKSDNGGHTKANGNDWYYAYDAAGRLKTVYYWPNGGSNTSVGDYRYGPDGELVRRTEGATTEYYVSFGGQVFFSWTAGGSATDFVYAVGGIGASKVGLAPPNYVFADGGGNVRLLVTPAQTVVTEYLYTPFGETIVVSNSVSYDYRFAGNNEREAIKLSYFHARWYDTSLGRFVTRDPIEAGAVATHALNLYIYALDNPKTFSDPSGTCPLLIGCLLIGAAIVGMIVVGAIVVVAAYDWYVNRATAAERQGFWIGVGGALIVVGIVAACVFTACTAAAALIPLLPIIAGDAALVGYVLGTRAAGGEPTLEGMTVSFAVGATVGDVAAFGFVAAVRLAPSASLREELLLSRARGAKVDLAVKQLPLRGRADATVTGGYNIRTGQIAAAGCRGSLCAENRVVELLGGNAAEVRFTEAVRPRTGNPVSICARCEATFGRDVFPPGTRFRSDEL